MFQSQSYSVLLNDFVSLFFPNYCMGCNVTLSPSEKVICLHCKSEIQQTNLHTMQPNILHQRFYELPSLRYAFAYSWFQQQGALQKMLHALKYKGHAEVGIYLGRLYGTILLETGYAEMIDYITSVPLHYLKYRKRGYNQSDLIAEGIAETSGIPFRKMIRKKYSGTSQTKKHRSERFENVENTFGILSKMNLRNKHILVVDDVLTTGATMQAACQPLVESAATVSIFTIAAVK
jgi:ComF family protein